MEQNSRDLNDTLLYLGALQDVDVSTIVGGQMIQWDATGMEWIPISYADVFTTSTSTSTTTSTTSTTTTCPLMYSADRLTGGTPSARGEFGVGFEADKASDDNTGTRWSDTGDVFPSWWKYDRGAGNDVEIRRLRIYPFEDPGDNAIRIKNFYLQYSDDDSGWTTHYTGLVPNSGEQWYTYNIPAGAGSHRYWRVWIVDSWDGQSASIYEFEMLECVTTTTTTTTTT